MSVDVVPVSGGLGAEIHGVDLGGELGNSDFATIREAFFEHGVIFFRDQEITPEQHIAFAERWGPINVNRFFTAVDGYPQIAEVRKEPGQTTNIGGGWHTDHSYDEVPAMGSILLAREVPPRGGDTLFASMYAAYDALSDGLKQTLSTLNAVHSSRHVFGKGGYHGDQTKGRIGNPELATQDAVHPIVLAHPDTGRKALYVNGAFTTHIEGWTVEESQPLLHYLYRHAARPEFTCRFQWHEGSIAFWDNRCTWHYAVNDYQGERRLMHRITVEGSKQQAELRDAMATYDELRGMDMVALRAKIRAGRYTGHTAAMGAGRLQANLAILPEAEAIDFFRFCQRNPKPCPLVGVSDTGDPLMRTLGDIDIRTDVPSYNVYRDGELVEQVADIRALWRDDLVAFALGCSFTFERALAEAGLPLRHVEQNKIVSMYKTSIQLVPAGRFGGGTVCSMRPFSPEDAERAARISRQFPQAHGAPLHIGDPARIGIADIAKPDWGDVTEFRDGEVPVFWACGVTPQAAILRARPSLCITHTPGSMLITDVPEDAEVTVLAPAA